MVEATSRRAVLRDKLLLGILYAVFFATVFVMALYWTFPYDRLRDFVASKLTTSDPMTGSSTVEIGELEPVGFGGLVVRDLAYTHLGIAPDATPQVLKLSEATAKVSILPLIFGNQHISLEASAGGGSLNGNFERDGDGKQVTMTLDALDVGAMGLGSWITLPLKGKVSGNVDLKIPNDMTKTTGNVDLEIAGLRVGDGKAKLKVPGMPGAGFTLDEIDAGKLKLTLEVQNAVAALKKFSADGRDLKLNGKGNVRLAEPWKRSRPELDLELTFSQAYKNKSERTKAMFDILGMQPDWQRAMTPDGAMHLHVGGTFQAIRGTPGH